MHKKDVGNNILHKLFVEHIVAKKQTTTICSFFIVSIHNFYLKVYIMHCETLS